jgi:hypothetical protein
VNLCNCDYATDRAGMIVVIVFSKDPGRSENLPAVRAIKHRVSAHPSVKHAKHLFYLLLAMRANRPFVTKSQLDLLGLRVFFVHGFGSSPGTVQATIHLDPSTGGSVFF